MKAINDMKRVEAATDFIAQELKTLLARNYDSPMSRQLQKTVVYRDGLTNGERLLATMRALSLVQLEVAADLGSLTTEASDWRDQDDSEAA